MYEITILTKRKPGTSREEFFEHYKDTHFRLASALPGLISYQQKAIEHNDHAWSTPEQHPDYDALSVYSFASYESAHAAFDSEFGKIVDEDTGTFIDWPSVIFVPSAALQRFDGAADTDAEHANPENEAAARHLRLVWPQWQGVGTDIATSLASEFPLAVARRGYTVGTQVLEAVLPSHNGPTAHVQVDMTDAGTETADGVEAKPIVLAQLHGALQTIRTHHPERITTLGGECSVSVAPFTTLAEQYGDDLAVIWIDSHPDAGTGDSEYPGYHAMAVSTITGHGDSDVLAALPATVDANRVALVGLHSWTDDDFPNVADWGISSFAPDTLRSTSDDLLSWLRQTGATKVAIHLDVDTIDSTEMTLGLGVEPDGLRSTEVQRIVRDLTEHADLVGFTIAEYYPRQVMQMQSLAQGLPLT